MKNTIKFIPVLLATPMLFMGTKISGEQSGGAYPHYYEEFQLTALTFGEADEEGTYPFTATIENSGDQYIAINTFEIMHESGYFRFADENVIGEQGGGICLAPHSSGTYKALANASEVFTINNCTPYCYAYEIATDENLECEYTGFRYIGKQSVNDGAYYSFEASDYSYYGDDYHYYSKMVDVDIKGVHYAFFDDYANASIKIGLVDSTLTEEDFTITNLQLIQGMDNGKKFSEGLMKGLGVAVLAIGGALLAIFTLGVFPIFILPPIIRKATAKKNK